MKKSYNVPIAILSGLLMAAAWPLKGFTPLLFIAWIPLLYLEDRIDKGAKGKVFLLALITFLVWNVLTTWWIWNASPAASLGFVLNAMFMTVVFWLFHITKKRLCNNRWGNFILIFFWMGFELLHYYWGAKFPWLSLGNAFSTHTSWIQWYEYTGVAGGTLWVLLVNILIFNIISLIVEKKYSRSLWIQSALTLLLIIVPIFIGKNIYRNYEEQGDNVEAVVVQQNCDPWSEQYELSSKEIVDRNIGLADQLVTPNTRFIISSESALQEGIWLDNLDRSNSIRYLNGYISSHPETAFVIGGTTYEFVPKGMEDDFAARKFADVNKYYYSHNTALLIDTTGVQHRNKTKLVPGVEAIPSWMKFLKNFSVTMAIARGTLKGDAAPHNLSFDGHQIAVMICYESAFGGYVSEFVDKGADLIFVITNDGWWKNTLGHRQHFEMSKLRAIENRRCVARSANTGISGFINQRGDVMQKTKYWEQDVIRQTLKANRNLTFYTKHGDYLYRIAAWGSALIALWYIVSLFLKRKK